MSKKTSEFFQNPFQNLFLKIHFILYLMLIVSYSFLSITTWDDFSQVDTTLSQGERIWSAFKQLQ